VRSISKFPYSLSI